MNKRSLVIIQSAACALFGCGSYSDLTTDDGSDVMIPPYGIAIVLDFEDSTEPKHLSGEKLVLYRESVELAGRRFADLITTSIRKKRIFKTVLRELSDIEALVISGEIHRYVEGDAAARALIGLGAGSSYFDSIVLLTDNRTNESLGRLEIDKNSWVLGGIVSAAQNIEGFMRGGAKKTAAELRDAKLGIVAAK